MTTLIDKPPTKEQIERIRQVSKVALGSHGAAFEKWGYPSTRGQASDLIHKIDQSRKWRGEDHAVLEEEPMEQPPAFNPPVEDLVLEKTCTKCEQTKPLDEFGRDKKAKDGLSATCKQCNRDRAKANRARAKDGSDVARRPRKPKVEPKPHLVHPHATEHDHFAMASDPEPGPPWLVYFEDPTLSQLEILSSFLGGVSLDEAAQATRHIAGAFGPKGAQH